jgi:Fic family protein
MNSWTKLTEALSELPILEQVNDEKRQLDALKPLPQEVESRVMQKIRLDWNYHSNAIEGNKLTFGETYTFLMYGLTAKGKPLKDHLDIKGHNEAINFLISVVKEDADLTEVDIRNLHKMVLVESYESPALTPDGQKTHKMILVGDYKKMPNHVKTPTGEMHYYANPEDVPMLMGELVQWYNEARKNPTIHPSVLAAFFHHRFVAIHPFDDGNGRLGRILMNLILMQKGYPPAVVKLKERTDYYAVLGQADKNEYVPLMEFVAETVLESLGLYLKAARGESIEEDSDIDKEIALFTASFNKIDNKKSIKTTKNVIENFFLKVYDKALPKLSKFDDLFESNTIEFFINYENGTAKQKNKELILSNYLGKNIYGITINYEWSNFLKNSLTFSFFSNCRLYMLQNYFEIGIDTEKIFSKEKIQTIMSKPYSDTITEKEINDVANTWVRLTMEDLKKKIAENHPSQ